MATNKITYTLDFKANFKDVQGQLTNLKNSLNSVIGMQLNGGHLNSDIKAASNAAAQLKIHLRQALDPKTGKLDLTRLQNQMRITGISAKSLANDLLRGGHQGAQAYLQLSNAMLNAQKSGIRLNEITSQLWTTLKNTAKWQVSSYALTSLTSALSDSLKFATDLDKSLNDIRIVTGASREEMERFAIAANTTAKALSTSTKKVADATLIYRQQGDTAEEAAKKAEITIKAANASRTEAQEMSEYLTGIWNSYQVGADNLELFVDKLVKVGAVTATSSEELATSMTKVAATANTVGVGYDQLLSTIATVSSATRISAEQIGTAFKTIYARMGDLELKGSIDEDGVTTTLGTVSSSLKQVGVNVLDAQGNIKDMGIVIEDLGNKWQTMTLNEKTAIAEAVAGKRQYTQLFALFDNWDEYQRTLKEAGDAQGELNKQQAKYADSIEGAKARLKASKEELLLGVIDNETLQESIDLLADFTEGTGDLLKSFGGLVPLASMLFSGILMRYAPQVSNSLVNLTTSLFSFVGNGNKQMIEFQNTWNKTMEIARNTQAFQENPILMAELQHIKEKSELQLQYLQNQKKLTEVEREQVKVLMEQVEQERLSKIEQQERLKAQAEQRLDRVNTTQLERLQNMTFNLNDFNFSSAFLNSTGNLQAFGKEVDKTQASIYALAKAFNDALGPTEQEQMITLLQQRTEFQRLNISIQDLLDAFTSLEGYQTEMININNNSVSSYKNIIDSFSIQTKSVKELEQEMDLLIQKRKQYDETTGFLKQDSGPNRGITNKDMVGNYKNGITRKEFEGYQTIQSTAFAGKPLKTEEIQQAIGFLDKLSQSSNISKEKIDELKFAFLQLSKGKKPIQEIDALLLKFKTDAENLNTKLSMTNIVNGFVSASSAAMSFSSAINMVISAIENFDESPITSLFSIVGSIGMVVSSMKMFGTGFQEISDIFENRKKKESTATKLASNSEREYNKEVKKGIPIKEKSAHGSKKKSKASKKEASANAMNKTSENSKKTGEALSFFGGKLGLTVMGITAVVAILIKLYNTFSLAARKTREYTNVTEELNKVQEKVSKNKDEITSLENLSEKLEQAKDDKKALLEVSKDLNKEIGYVPGLVEGEAKAYEIASARLQKYIELKKQEAEKEGRKAGTLGKAQYESITIEKSGFDIAKTKDIQEAMQEVAKMSEEELEKFRQDGKVQGMTYKDYTQALQKMQEAQEVAFKEVYENANLAVGGASTLRGFGEVLAASYVDTKITEQFFKDIQDKDLQEIINEYLETGDSGKLNKVFKDLEKEYGVIPGMTEELREYKDIIYSMQNDELDAVKNFSTASLDTTKSFSNLNKVLKSSSALIQDYAKDGKLTWDNISTFVKDLKENYGIQDAELEQIQVKLINNDLQGGINQAIQLVIGKLKTDLGSGTKDYATAVSSATAMLSAAGISNAKEMATYLLRSAGAEAALAKNTATTIQLLGDKKSELKEIANTYGLIEAEMYSILLNEKIFASGNKNKESDIAAWATQVSNNSDIILSDDQKKYLDFIVEQAKGGTLEGLDEAIRLLDKQIVVNNLKSKDSTLYSKIEEDRIEAEKEYKRSIDKWIKDDALAKIEDRIEEFTNTLEKESRKIKSIDWLKDNFGIDNYEEKVSSLTESIKISLQELDEFSQVEIIGAEQAEAIEGELSNSYDNFHNYIEQLLEATDNLSTKEAEQLTEVITKQYELISVTLDGMNKILEINSRQEGMFSQEKEKNALLKVFGNTLGSVSEEEQKRNKRLRLEEKLQIDILEIEKRYQKEINKAALISTKKGVEERQKEREYEKEQIEKAYREAMSNCKLALKSLSDLTKTETDKMVIAFTNAINAAKGFKDEINSIQFPSTMGFNPKEVEKGKISNFDAYTVKTKGGTGEYRNDLVYESKSGEALGVYAPKGLTGTVVDTGESKHGHWVKIQDETGNITTVARIKELDSSIKKGTEITAGTSLGKSKSWRVRDTIHHNADRTWSDKTLKGLGAYSEKENYSLDEVKKEPFIEGVEHPILGDSSHLFINYNIGARKKSEYYDDYNKGKLINGIHMLEAPRKGYVFKEDDGWYSFSNQDFSNGFKFKPSGLYNESDIVTGAVDVGRTIMFGSLQKKGRGYDATTVQLDLDWKPRGSFAKGSDSTPAGEAFVGEEGRELILLPDGKIVLAGQDGMELANLPQGARVLTNEETEEILRNKKDYANLILSETSKSGQKVAFERYAEGTNSLQNEDFLSDTSKLQEEFYQEELDRQQEQNSAIKTSLENKNKQVEKETDKHYKSLENKTKEMSSSIQKIMGETSVKLPEIESEDFIDSLEKTITKAYLMIYGGGEWLTPVQGTITSKFGKRDTGIKGASTSHKGIDIGATSGMPILATRDGKVVASTSNKESGYYIRIDHGDGYVSAYAHMKELSNLKPGDKVSQGDVIGYVGSTGISSGAHLHFAVYKDGKAIDPEKLIAHARGGVTKQGKALVGEYGREIILYPDGTAGILGSNGMEFADLPAGAQIIPNEETEKILNNPVDYKVPSFANGTSFNWNNEIQKEMEEWLSGLSQANRASQASSILKFYNDYENKTKEEITAFTSQLAFDAMGEAGRIHKEGIAFITQLWKDYQKSGEKNVAFELWIASQAETLGEKYDEAIEKWEERVEQQRQAYQADLEFNKRTRTIQGSWNSKKELDNAHKQLTYDLEHSPEDMEKIFEDWENYINASETYMNDYLAEFNRQYSELIRVEEERITRLEQLKTLQEGINQETNSYREVMHDINKELNSSRISTQWLDEKTKQYLFNEQDYLAVSEKAAEVRSAALQDWEDTQEAINNLSNDELYKAQYLNEAYQERADIRAKELGVLREELNLQKKQTALNEALMERNVRVFSGGRWRQIANVENVRKAQEDLDETRYQIETKQIELDQQKDINTTYNEPLRESNQQIAGWNKIMELAAKALEDDFRELKGTVEVTDLSLESFREELGYIVEDIKADRAILAKRYGLENGVTKEEFESKLKPNELAENVVLIAKRMYDAGNTEGAKAFVEEYRSMMPEWLQKETAENITADAVEQGIKSRYGKTLTIDEVLNNIKNEEHKDIIGSYNQDLGTYEVAIYRNKAEYERLVNEGASYDDPRLKFISETTNKLREDYITIGGDENRLGTTESAKDYYKMIEEKYGTDFVSELAQETATDFTNRMIDIIDNYQSLAIEAVEFLESVQTDFSKLSSENLETVFTTIDTWQAKILIRLKELESKESTNGTIVVEQANATGTRDAQSGLSLVNEKGVEMLSTDYGQIIELNPHQKIFNNDQMNFLYDLSREGLRGMDRTVSAISNNMQDNSLSIEHLEVKLDNVTNVKTFAEELQGLTSYIRNTKTILK